MTTAETLVLVADPMSIFREGVRTVLEGDESFVMIEAGSLDEVEIAIQDDCPDVALVDLGLPPSGGVAGVRRLAGCASTQTVVWSFEPDRETVLEAIRAGACGYLHKDTSPEGLMRALRGLMRGEAPLARDLAGLMIDALHADGRREQARRRLEALSQREREVLTLLARGARNRQIALELAISEFTVKRHVQNILRKLDVPSRRAAAAVHRSVLQPASVLRETAGAAFDFALSARGDMS